MLSVKSGVPLLVMTPCDGQRDRLDSCHGRSAGVSDGNGEWVTAEGRRSTGDIAGGRIERKSGGSVPPVRAYVYENVPFVSKGVPFHGGAAIWGLGGTHIRCIEAGRWRVARQTQWQRSHGKSERLMAHFDGR